MAKRQKQNNSLLTIVLVVAAVFLFTGGNISSLTGNAAQRGSQATTCNWDGQTILAGKSAVRYVSGGVLTAYCDNGQLLVDFCARGSLSQGGYSGLVNMAQTHTTSIDNVLFQCAPLDILNSAGVGSGTGVGLGWN